MARTPAGLSDEQVAALRAALLANKRPKVTVAGQQFGGETTGQVVSVGDAETEGPEFVQVRVTLDGLTDVLRFAPRELRLPQRGRATPSKPAPAKPATAAKPAAPATPAAAKPAAVPQPAPAPAAAPKSAAVRPAPRPRKAAVRPPTVTITITSSGTDWTVSAIRGGKSVLKAVPIAPGTVAAAVALLGETSISAAVEEVNGAALSLAQQRAEELRAELAAVESLLAAHRPPGR